MTCENRNMHLHTAIAFLLTPNVREEAETMQAAKMANSINMILAAVIELSIYCR
jgi:hypothetical protein